MERLAAQHQTGVCCAMGFTGLFDMYTRQKPAIGSQEPAPSAECKKKTSPNAAAATKRFLKYLIQSALSTELLQIGTGKGCHIFPISSIPKFKNAKPAATGLRQ